jgi:hypothetical protein
MASKVLNRVRLRNVQTMVALLYLALAARAISIGDTVTIIEESLCPQAGCKGSCTSKTIVSGACTEASNMKNTWFIDTCNPGDDLVWQQNYLDSKCINPSQDRHSLKTNNVHFSII